MHIQINTDNTIQGDERVVDMLEETVSQGLKNISDRLTRVEVHVKDIRGDKGGEDISVTIEGRPEGMRPYAANETGKDILTPARQAANTLQRRLLNEFKKRDRKRK